MKVLVINWRDINNPEAGGAEVYIDEVLKKKPSDWKVDFISTSFKNSKKKEIINGYNVIRIPNNLLFNFTFKYFWRKFFSKNHYDLIVDVISKIPLATPLYIRNIPILSIHYHIHGKSLFKELPYPMALYVYLMEKHFLRYYTKVPTLLIAESDKQELEEIYKFENLYIAYCGIDVSFMKDINPFKKSEIPTLLYFGRLKKYKRVDHIIKAFALVIKKIPNAVFYIAGKGDDEERLKDIVNIMKLNDSVKFMGFISEKDKGKCVSESWVFTITSEKEGWGIVVIEANAGALPVVGYNVEGIRDSIKDGYSGYLVENGNINQLAEKIVLLLNNNKLRNLMSQNALEWSNHFRWDKTAEIFYSIANKLIQKFH